MKLIFVPIDLGNSEHLHYTYELQKQRFRFKDAIVGNQQLPSFKQHAKNLKEYFEDFRLIYYRDIRIGIVGLNKNGSLTHNYDFRSIRKNIKKITRKQFEIGYTILTQYAQLVNRKKCFVQMNPKNNKAFILFLRMFEANTPGIFKIDNIQINLSLIE
jgi:hypothetical protein